MKLTAALLALGLVACIQNYDVTRVPGVHTPAPLDPAAHVVHDAPSVAALQELGRVRVDQNALGSPTKCEEHALDAARSKLGGALFYVHAVDNSLLGINGNPSCEVIAYARKP
jgi:hypothetical protein